MLNITKITNREDAFLISYYSEGSQITILAEGANLITELNKAFKSMEEYNQKAMERELAYRSQGLGSQCVPVGNLLGSLNQVTVADTKAEAA